MYSKALVLGVCALTLAALAVPARAEEEAARAHPVADVAKADGSTVTWISGGLTATLPAGWAIDEDTGKKDTDLHLEDAKAHEYVQMTTAETGDFGTVCEKMCGGILSAGKGKEDGKSKRAVADCKGIQSVLSISSGDHNLKYQVTAFAKDNITYVVLAFSAAEGFDAASKHFDAVLDSIKFSKSGGGGGSLAGLQGQWDVVSMAMDGKEAPADAVKGMVLTVKDDTYKLAQGANEVESGKLKFGEGKALDWLIESGNDKGKTQQSIYQLEGGSFSFSASQPGKDERPKELGNKAGQAYVVLKKK